jgi:hypothetical protein
VSSAEQSHELYSRRITLQMITVSAAPKAIVLNKYSQSVPPSKSLSSTRNSASRKARPSTPKVRIVSVSVSSDAVYFLYCLLHEAREREGKGRKENFLFYDLDGIE